MKYSYLFCFVLFFPLLVCAKVDILVLDFNQTTETDVLRKLVKSCSKCENCSQVEIKSLLNSEYEGAGAKEKIEKLCESDYLPGIMIFSGHFASAWTGDRGYLSLKELEDISCL